jgi:hypothetical protein
MARINEKLRLSIGTHVRSILEDRFDEDTVKLLLIDIRDFSSGRESLREICHFVAHPERDQGSIHRKILSRFLRLKYMNQTMEDAMAQKDVHIPRPREDFGDYVFRTIPLNHYKIFEKKYFETVMVEGMNDFDESFFDKIFGRSKTEISRLVTANYKKKDGKFLLRTTYDQDIIRIVFILETSVQFRPLISRSDILGDLKNALLRIASELGLEKSDVERIFAYGDELFLAILGLLHDMSFVWNGTIIGRSFLAVQKSKIGLTCDFYPNGKLFSFPLVGTGSLIENYVDGEVSVVGELKQFTLRRSLSGRLVYM